MDNERSQDLLGTSLKRLEKKGSVPFSFTGQTFDPMCQKLILNVWDFFRRVKKNPEMLDRIKTPQERAAAALHINPSTIGKIGRRYKLTGKLLKSGARRNRSSPIVGSVTEKDENTIKEIVKELESNRVTPTVSQILSQARNRINFTGGATSFRRVLRRMGLHPRVLVSSCKERLTGGTKTSSGEEIIVKSLQKTNPCSTNPAHCPKRLSNPLLSEAFDSEDIKSTQDMEATHLPISLSIADTLKDHSKQVVPVEVEDEILKMEDFEFGSTEDPTITVIGENFEVTDRETDVDTSPTTFIIPSNAAFRLLRENSLQPVHILYSPSNQTRLNFNEA